MIGLPGPSSACFLPRRRFGEKAHGPAQGKTACMCKLTASGGAATEKTEGSVIAKANPKTAGGPAHEKREGGGQKWWKTGKKQAQSWRTPADKPDKPRVNLRGGTGEQSLLLGHGETSEGDERQERRVADAAREVASENHPEGSPPMSQRARAPAQMAWGGFACRGKGHKSPAAGGTSLRINHPVPGP